MNILGSPPPAKPLLCHLGLGEGVKAGGGRRRHKDVISVAIKTTGQEPHNLRSGDFFFLASKKENLMAG